jgi:hypothetical protein
MKLTDSGNVSCLPFRRVLMLNIGQVISCHGQMFSHFFQSLYDDTATS